MPEYYFTKEIRLTPALDDYLSKQNIPTYNGVGYDSDTFRVIVITNDPLDSAEQNNLTTIINDYIDPEYFLSLSRTANSPLSSGWTQTDQPVFDGKTVMQTFIYNGNTAVQGPNEILDGVKTIFEYYTPNVQNFLNFTTSDLDFEIYNLTLNTSVVSRTIDLGSIATQWQTMAQNGSTSASTMYRTELFSGMMNSSPGYDCIWQFRGAVRPESIFDFRVNSYQELYYNKIE